MGHSLRQKDGTTVATTQTVDLGSPAQLTVLVVPGNPAKGGDVYVKESVAANGDTVWRWHRYEPPAK